MKATQKGLFAAMVLLACGCMSSNATVTHVVICWLKNPGDEAARQQLVDVSATLRKIPGVVSVAAGCPIPSTRPVVDSSYDVAVIVTFKDEASLRAYDTDPIHQKAVREVIRPLAGKIVIYDVRHGGPADDKEKAGATVVPAAGTEESTAQPAAGATP